MSGLLRVALEISERLADLAPLRGLGRVALRGARTHTHSLRESVNHALTFPKARNTRSALHKILPHNSLRGGGAGGRRERGKGREKEEGELEKIGWKDRVKEAGKV